MEKCYLVKDGQSRIVDIKREKSVSLLSDCTIGERDLVTFGKYAIYIFLRRLIFKEININKK